MVNSLYQKRGGHCFFIFKSGVIPENTRFLIKNGVSDLTLPKKMRRKRDDSRFYTGRFEDFLALFWISQPASNDFGLYYAETE